MSTPDDELDARILAILGTDDGYTTGDVAAKCSHGPALSKRDWTTVVRKRLLALRQQGLVGELDDQKPVCWVRVAASQPGTGSAT